MRVEIVVDELLLSGFDPRDRHRIADALERELAAATIPDAVVRLANERPSIDAIGPIHALPAAGRHASATPGNGREEPAVIARSVSGAIATALGTVGRST